MGQVLHGSARTTEAVRRAIQHSQASLRALARRHGVNPKTIAKWKNRSSVTDRPPKSTVLSAEQEAVVIAFRRHTLLPLDDCLYALQATIPQLTDRRCTAVFSGTASPVFPMSRATGPGGRSSSPIPSATSISISQRGVRSRANSICWLQLTGPPSSPSSNCTSEPRRRSQQDFLKALIEAVPYKIHTVPTDNGVHFTTPGNRCSAVAEIKLALQQRELFRAHAFEFACAKADIDHRLTKPKHPWTNGQVERMNRTLKEATVQRFFSQTHDQLRRHLTDFVAAYNFARRRKTLKGLTPYESSCALWTKEPQRFKLNPHHLSLRSYS